MEAHCLVDLMGDPKGAQWEELMVIRRLEHHLDFLIQQEDQLFQSRNRHFHVLNQLHRYFH